MSRTLETRLRKLEARRPPGVGRWHRIIGHTDEELAEKRAELMASPTWTEGDGIIERLIVEPAQRPAASITSSPPGEPS